MLEKGYNYQAIGETLKVSTATIAQVNRARKYGSLGYKKFIAKILREESINQIFESVISQITALPAKGTKGAGVWKLMHKKKPKPIF